MRWEKKGHVFVPASESWMHAYAQVPTPLVVDDIIRIFVGCRPRNSTGLPISQIGYVDVALDDPRNVIAISHEPVLALGSIGCFDEFGLHPLSVIRVGNEVWLYYVGWTRMMSVPFNRAIGLAVSTDGGVSFHRKYRGPILGATHNEPFLQQGPLVKRINSAWHMWYLTGTDWIPDPSGRLEAIYRIVHATSKDGLQWQRDGLEVLPTKEEHECHAGQAIICRDGKWHMWFSYRRGLDFRNAEGGYRIGYASSADLVKWERDDGLAGILPSEFGWDSEMICYPNILEANGQSLMFYCGNHFGRDGFGYATLEA